jgi:hypothetical protein
MTNDRYRGFTIMNWMWKMNAFKRDDFCSGFGQTVSMTNVNKNCMVFSYRDYDVKYMERYGRYQIKILRIFNGPLDHGYL